MLCSIDCFDRKRPLLFSDNVQARENAKMRSRSFSWLLIYFYVSVRKLTLCNLESQWAVRNDKEERALDSCSWFLVSYFVREWWLLILLKSQFWISSQNLNTLHKVYKSKQYDIQLSIIYLCSTHCISSQNLNTLNSLYSSF